ncbi:hypothetical protein D083_0454 [Dickeya solani RNS 08.23.3.1.A]|nr:hypothetical protein D083_0454 [Dickeya solani RNS 08.23.3.1.A]
MPFFYLSVIYHQHAFPSRFLIFHKKFSKQRSDFDHTFDIERMTKIEVGQYNQSKQCFYL